MLSKILFMVSLPLLVTGLLKKAGKHRLFTIFCALYAILLLVMPFRQGIRYILPLLPFYLFFTIQGFDSLFEGIARKGARIVSLTGYAFLVLYFGVAGYYFSTSFGIRQIADGPYTEKATETFEFIKTHTGSEDVIVFFKPRAMLLITKRRAIRITEPAQLDRGDYIVMCDQKITSFQVPDEIISEIESKGEIRKIFTNSEFSVYRYTE
jgi:hypothetical protein